MTWFTKGEDAYEEEEERRKKAAGSRGFDPRGIFRFYMPKDGDPKIVMLLDDEPFNTYVHQFPVNGNWGNFVTCPKKTGVDKRCPLCERDKYARNTGHYTLLDITGWGSGSEHRMGIKILPATSDLVSKLRRKRKRKGTLIGSIFEVFRDGKSAVGDGWEFAERVSPGEYLADHIDEIWKSLSYFPEEWGFWEWKEGMRPGESEDVGDEERKNNRNYFLKGLPFMEILEPMSYEDTKAYVDGGDTEDTSFNFGANKSDDDDDEGGASNDVMY
jgi:hypothetical protein